MANLGQVLGFWAFTEPNNSGCIDVYYSMTSDPEYQHQPSEEMRLQDDNAGQYGRIFSTYAVANTSSVNVGGTTPLPPLRSTPDRTLE